MKYFQFKDMKLMLLFTGKKKSFQPRKLKKKNQSDDGLVFNRHSFCDYFYLRNDI